MLHHVRKMIVTNPLCTKILNYLLHQTYNNPTLLTLVKFSRFKVEKLPAVTLAGLLALSINMLRLFLNVLLAVYHSQKYAAFTIFRLCNPNMMFGKVQSHLNKKTHFIRLRSSKRANGT